MVPWFAALGDTHFENESQINCLLVRFVDWHTSTLVSKRIPLGILGPECIYADMDSQHIIFYDELFYDIKFDNCLSVAGFNKKRKTAMTTIESLLFYAIFFF